MTGLLVLTCDRSGRTFDVQELVFDPDLGNRRPVFTGWAFERALTLGWSRAAGPT